MTSMLIWLYIHAIVQHGGTGMSILIPLIHFGGIVSYPQDRIMTALGLPRTATGWEHLRKQYARHFGVGLEVRGSFPLHEGPGGFAGRAREAVDMAIERFGDFLVNAHIRVVEGPLPDDRAIQVGYGMDLTIERDWERPILMEITLDRATSSCRIMALSCDHAVDGAPLMLLVQLVFHHLAFGSQSILPGIARRPLINYEARLRRLGMQSNRERWSELLRTDSDALVPAGGQIDCSRSAIVALRRRLAEIQGSHISLSSLETALVAMTFKLNWATEYIAQGESDARGLLAIQRGYHGLGMVRTMGWPRIMALPAQSRLEYLGRILTDSAQEIKQERQGMGRSSRFYNRYRRIPGFWTRLFDRRIPYGHVMAVAGTQLIGSNLNGVEYGVPLVAQSMRDGDHRFLFIPSHGEHGNETKEARMRRNLATQVTEVSFSCGPKVSDGSGHSMVYKSLKLSPATAARVLISWGANPRVVLDIPPLERVARVFHEAYRPDAPMEGKIERLAASLLNEAEV